MKIKKCCNDMENVPDEEKEMSIKLGKFGGVYYSYLYVRRYTGMDDNQVKITYCPFCGKKIEVE